MRSSRLSPPPPKRLLPPRRRRIRAEARDTATTLDKGHGRLERRTWAATTAPNEYLDRPGVARVGRVASVVERGGVAAREARYFITGAPRQRADAGVSLTWARGHRSIENRSHDVRDVTLGEGASRIREGCGPEIMAALRNAAIGRSRATGATNIAETLRRTASQVGGLFTKLGIFKK